jgi:1-acyl-sn-glycerol-3-phosphate acyltransferase/ketosteroid isomerase-like protein
MGDSNAMTDPAPETVPLHRAPDRRQLDRLATILAPVRRVIQPKMLGVEHIPHRPVLFVGNHSRYALLDLPLMIGELWMRRRIVIRPLGEHAHYALPVWRDLLEMGGMVRGTRAHVRALMRDGQNILVFPGGTGEVFKGRGQDYKLIWKERLGFARLAIESGYPIVPFAAVGAEEMFHVVVDREMPVAAQLSALMRRLVGLPLPPIPRGIGPTVFPRPERLYFWFGQPVDTSRYGGGAADDAAARAVRDEVRGEVETGIQILLAERERDPHRRLLTRLWHEAHELPQLAANDPDAWLVTRAFEAWSEHGVAGAAAWMSRWVQLTDPPEWPGAGTWRGRERALARLEEVTSELGATSAEVTEARTIRDRVLAVFELRNPSGSPTSPSGFAALIEVDAGQILRMAVFLDRQAALRALENEAHAPA